MVCFWVCVKALSLLISTNSNSPYMVQIPFWAWICVYLVKSSFLFDIFIVFLLIMLFFPTNVSIITIIIIKIVIFWRIILSAFFTPNLLICGPLRNRTRITPTHLILPSETNTQATMKTQTKRNCK